MSLQIIKQCFCLCFLYRLARQDCRWKRIDAGLLYGFLAVGMGCFALELLLNKGKGNISTTRSILFLSLLPGLLFLVMGVVTQEAVGYGDGLSVLAMGFYMEAYVLWKVVGLSLGFLTAYVFGQKLLWKHRYKQEQRYEQKQKHRQKYKYKQKQKQEYKQEQENRQVQKSREVPFLPFLLTGIVVVLGAS